MSRVILFFSIAILAVGITIAAPVPKGAVKPKGVLVIDDCDEVFRGKEKYSDNLTLFDSDGDQKFRITGFNQCQSIGSSHMVVTDVSRDSIWTIENVGKRLRRFDLKGKETLSVPDVEANGIAIDPETGFAWVLLSQGTIDGSQLSVFDLKGKVVATYEVNGFDIVYDKTSKAFWIAGKKLTKIKSEKGTILCSVDVAAWCVASVDVDPKSGSVWLAEREHSQVFGSKNRLLKYGSDGKPMIAIDLLDHSPFRLSIDPHDGSVWSAKFRKSIIRYSSDGKKLGEYEVEAVAVQADPSNGDVWVVTSDEVQKLNSKGQVRHRAKHAGKTSQAWITVLE